MKHPRFIIVPWSNFPIFQVPYLVIPTNLIILPTQLTCPSIIFSTYPLQLQESKPYFLNLYSYIQSICIGGEIVPILKTYSSNLQLHSKIISTISSPSPILSSKLLFGGPIISPFLPFLHIIWIFTLNGKSSLSNLLSTSITSLSHPATHCCSSLQIPPSPHEPFHFTLSFIKPIKVLVRVCSFLLPYL